MEQQLLNKSPQNQMVDVNGRTTMNWRGEDAGTMLSSSNSSTGDDDNSDGSDDCVEGSIGRAGINKVCLCSTK